MEKLHPGGKWLFRIGAYFTLGIIGIFLAFWIGGIMGNLAGRGTATIIALIFYISFVIIGGEIYTQMAYNNWRYEFTNRGLKLERGIIWKRYSNIPYERIQNVDIHRGILARMLGFSTIDIQTAGYSGYGHRGGKPKSEGHIPAVSISKGEKIREKVMKNITGKSRKGM